MVAVVFKEIVRFNTGCDQSRSEIEHPYNGDDESISWPCEKDKRKELTCTEGKYQPDSPGRRLLG